MSSLMKQLDRLAMLVEGQRDRTEQFDSDSNSKRMEMKGKLESLGKRMAGLADFVDSGNTKDVIVGLRKVIDDANMLLGSLGGGDRGDVSQGIKKVIKRRKASPDVLKKIVKKSAANDSESKPELDMQSGQSDAGARRESRERERKVIDLARHPIKPEHEKDAQSASDPLGMGESLSEHIAAVMKASEKMSAVSSSSEAKEG